MSAAVNCHVALTNTDERVAAGSTEEVSSRWSFHTANNNISRNIHYMRNISRFYKPFFPPFSIFSPPIIYNFTSGMDLMDWGTVDILQ